MKGPIGKLVDVPDVINDLSHQIIGCAIAVHRELGYDFLERIYEDALCYELNAAGLAYRRQAPIIVRYKSVQLAGQRVDLLVEDLVVVEIKAVELVADAHLAQLVNYIRAGGYPVGLLINFHTMRLIDDVYRRVNSDAVMSLTPEKLARVSTPNSSSAPSALPLRPLRSM
jgi:GxxExxY protein